MVTEIPTVGEHAARRYPTIDGVPHRHLWRHIAACIMFGWHRRFVDIGKPVRMRNSEYDNSIARAVERASRW